VIYVPVNVSTEISKGSEFRFLNLDVSSWSYVLTRVLKSGR